MVRVLALGAGAAGAAFIIFDCFLPRTDGRPRSGAAAARRAQIGAKDTERRKLSRRVDLDMRYAAPLVLAGAYGWAPTCSAFGAGRTQGQPSGACTRAGRIVAGQDSREEEAATRKRLKKILLEEEGRRRIERREALAPMVAKDLERVRKEGGVSGTPGIMFGPPPL